MTQRSETAMKWFWEIGTKLGVPTMLFVMLWWSANSAFDRLVVPLSERLIKHFDVLEKAITAQTDTDKEQTKVLSEMRTAQNEEVIRSREQVTALKEQNALLTQIKNRDGM